MSSNHIANKSNKYILTIQQYEHAPSNLITINEGENNDTFITDLLISEDRISKYKNHLSDEFGDWNNWYKEIVIKNEEKKNENVNSNIQNDETESKDIGTSSISEYAFSFVNAPSSSLTLSL